MASSHYVPMTKKGLEKTKAELQKLKSRERPKAIEAVATARAHGDLSENAEYDAAKERQASLEKRIAGLEEKIRRAQIVDQTSSDEILFGARVKVQEEGTNDIEEYHLVGADESDPAGGKISTASPMGKSLLKKKRNDVVEISTPGGVIKMKIVDFSYDS